MSARRQSSTTSLSRYARDETPEDLDNRSLDFCNSFWGLGDGGVEVLFARMRGAARTAEELRNFWRERATIEDEYAKRMLKLAKQVLGRDEIGDLRMSLDILKSETEKQAQAHLLLANAMRKELEMPATEFINKQATHKRTFQAAIEKSFKAKQTQENYVNKAREKYEGDCLRINSYTAQSTLVQGKDLDKIQLKLERAQQTVQGNERDYANFSRALADTLGRWEREWKTFCDQCQDLEEERVEFMKDNMWAYANAVSTVCVSDDESCEKLRVALEQLEVERDMENFVYKYGTGATIPDPPPFVNYAATESQAPRQTTRNADFARSSVRTPATRLPPPAPDEEPTGPGNAGVGAVGRAAQVENATQPSAQNKASSRRSSMNGIANQADPSSQPTVPPAQATKQPQPAPQPAVPAQNFSPSQYSATPQVLPASSPQPSYRPGPSADLVDPTAKVGQNTYPAHLDQIPQQSGSSMGKVGDEGDPLARALAELRKPGGSVRRPGAIATTRRETVDSFSPPTQDYRTQAESIVGAHPSSSSRPPSPAPHAAHMMPRQPRSPSPLPDDKRGRSDTRGNQGQTAIRSASREGYAGVGAQGRSPSPQPFRPPTSSVVNPSLHSPPASGNRRSTSPAPLGISLDTTGNVSHDSMAEEFRRAQQSQFQNPQRPSWGASQTPQPTPANQYPPQGMVQGPAYGTQQAQPQNYPGFSPSTPGSAPLINPYSPAGAIQPQQYPGHQQPAPANGYPNGLHRGPSLYAPYSHPPAQHIQPVQQPTQLPISQPAQQPPTQTYAQPGYSIPAQLPPQARVPSPQPAVVRSPSPAPPTAAPPTGQFFDGVGVLFYVKALYDYTATIDEEFDFQAGDVIAVTATPEDGWWSGILLDDNRRVPGRTIFPSNFVCLF